MRHMEPRPPNAIQIIGIVMIFCGVILGILFDSGPPLWGAVIVAWTGAFALWLGGR
jgi:hypothetical protein